MHLSFFTEKISTDSRALVAKSFRMPIVAASRRRILVADDHVVYRECLIRLLHELPGLDVIGDAEDGLQAIELATLLHPDVVLMDVDMPRMSGIEATRQIVKALPEIRIIGLSMHNHEDIVAQMLSAGAVSYFMKDGPIEQLLTAIQS
jgi:two-component system, NarL family, response regulator NreC